VPSLFLLLIAADRLLSWKLLLVAACTVMLLLIVRALSSFAASNSPVTPTYEPSLGNEADLPPSGHFRGEQAPQAKDLGDIRVTQFNFSQFDAVPGPPDPDSFADELMIELYDPRSEHRWQTSFVVGTPAGIGRLMHEQRWAFFYASEIFIVHKYDVTLIREAVYGRINEVRAQVGADPKPPLVG
jgi:hypothetical protein